MFRVKSNISKEIMKELFTPKVSPYDPRNKIRLREGK